MRARLFLAPFLLIMIMLFGGCRPTTPTADSRDPEPGVALTLATDRVRAIE
jgi:hypothetical protein